MSLEAAARVWAWIKRILRAMWPDRQGCPLCFGWGCSDCDFKGYNEWK